MPSTRRIHLNRPRPPRARDERRPGPVPIVVILLTIVLAVVLLPSASRADVPIIDFTDRPDVAILLTHGWTVIGCEGDAPLLCTSEGEQPQGQVEHTSFELAAYEQLSADLAAGVETRTALAREIDTFHEILGADRTEGCPPDYTYVPHPTVGATVAGLDGIRYGFAVLDGQGRLVEDNVNFITVRDDGPGGVVDVLAAVELNEGACLSGEDFLEFTDGGLGRFTADLTQLVARAQLGTGSRQVLQIPHDHQLTAEDAVATAISMAQLAVPGGSPGSSVLIARDNLFADALAAGGAQGVLDAPLLLTSGDRLDERVAAEIGRLGATRAVVLGGEAAVSPQVVADLQGLAMEVDRIAGSDRIATALAIADATAPEVERIVVVRADAGQGSDPTRAFADSLAAGALAATEGTAVVLTNGDHLDDRVAAWIEQRGAAGQQIQEAVIAGGQFALGTPVLQALVETGVGIDVADGADRAETAAVLNRQRQLPTAGHADAVVLVDGRSWADGLAAALLAHSSLSPIVLTDGESLPAASQAYLAAADPTEPPRIICTPSVTDTACAAAAQAVRGT